MPVVRVDMTVPAADPADVLDRVVDFERWPDLSDSVLAVRVEEEGGGRSTSWWEVAFREAVLKWSQRDEVDPEAVLARFELIEGDPLVFRGTWRAEADGERCRLTHEAEFDLGMPSLGHVLDPMAVEALEDALASVARGLFGDAVEVDFASTPMEGAA